MSSQNGNCWATDRHILNVNRFHKTALLYSLALPKTTPTTTKPVPYRKAMLFQSSSSTWEDLESLIDKRMQREKSFGD
jgi:hypothetical protein